MTLHPSTDKKRGATARSFSRSYRAPSQEQLVLLLTVVLFAFFSLTLQDFCSVANLLNLVRGISILGILGLGMGLIVIGRGIDLSMIAVMAAAWTVPLVGIEHGVSIGLGVLLSLCIALLIGIANGLIIAFVEVPPLFVTLATSFVIYGVGFWLAPAWVVYAPKGAVALLYFGRGHLAGIPMPIIVFLVASIGMHFCLSRTSVGRFVYAQGDNPAAARLSGVSLRPLIVFEYVLVALLAWLAGLVWIGATGSIQMNITQGTMVFDVLLVVVLGGVSLIGGRGGVLSVAVGCALIGTLLNAFTILDINSEAQNIIRGAVLLLAILLDNWLHPRDEETARQGD